MKNFYITFGQSHVHRVNGKTFDCDTVALIKADSEMEARKEAFSLFDNKWCTSYNDLESVHMEYYSRGVVEV